MAVIVVNPQAIAKIKSFVEDNAYREAIEQSSNYNARLCMERRLRLPFLDSQTGVAQNHSSLWLNRRERMPGQYPGQLYVYPSKRWRKKRRQYLLNESLYSCKSRDAELTSDLADMHHISMVENVGIIKNDTPSTDDIGGERLAALLSGVTADENSKESWHKDYEDASDPPDAGEIEDPDSDYEDYEEILRKKKKKVKGPATRGRGRRPDRNADGSEVEKPYSCEGCGTKYKTRPGLSYHYSHSHCGSVAAANAALQQSNSSAGVVDNPSRDLPPPPPPPSSQYHHEMTPPRFQYPSHNNPPVGIPPQGPPSGPHPSTVVTHVPNSSSTSLEMSTPYLSSSSNSTERPTPATSSDDPLAGLRKFQDSFLTFLKNPGSGQRSASGKPLANPSPYCDFCLGDHSENKKTGHSEELVSCADCGRSGHPSCLQFTPNMVESVKKYRWQCIECKSCGLCGTSDNDDQLLFCDDCDRGYHMYCLKPPLSEPPEGSWSCHLCIEEFGGKK